MMDRRAFIRHMALLAAGSAAMPGQIAAIEKLYNANTPLSLRPGEKWEHAMLSVEDWCVGFAMEPADRVFEIELFRLDPDGDRVPFIIVALNQRATFRWVRAPNEPILCHRDQLGWSVREVRHVDPNDLPVERDPVVISQSLVVTEASGRVFSITDSAPEGMAHHHLGIPFEAPPLTPWIKPE